MRAKLGMTLGCEPQEKMMVLSWPFYQASQKGDTADSEHETALQHVVYTCDSIVATRVAAMLRGRGGVGSRVEETGPYLPAESGSG